MEDRLRHIPMNDDDIHNRKTDIHERLASSGGVEKASEELIKSIKDRRTVVIAEPGSHSEIYLNFIGAEANAGGEDIKHIIVRPNPSKAAILEEFLHGVQFDVGILPDKDRQYAEYQVKDFMVRHSALLGLGDQDVKMLEVLRDRELKSEEAFATPENEKARKQLARESLKEEILSKTEHHTSHAVGAASVAVNVAQGNYGAAAVDAAAMAAENKAVQEAAVETAAKVGGSGIVKAFAACAKRAPVIGAAVTLAFVAKEAGAHMLDGEYKLAGAATVAGLAEAGGNVLGFGMGDAAREAARGAMIAAGGDEFAAVEKSGIRELGEAAYDVGKQLLASPPAQEPPEGRVLTDILPADIRSMTQGADEMGDRSEIRHVAVERTGLAANDPRNDLGTINQNPEGPKAHLLILADGRVQGPDEGGVPFDRNPSIAAGKNGETIGVMYAGQGAMNDAQWSTVRQITDYVAQQRRLEGRGGKPELMAGSTATADMLGLPTPRGSQLAQTTQTPAFHQRQAMGGMA